MRRSSNDEKPASLEVVAPASAPAGKEHEDIVAGLLKSPGVEIGAFDAPIPGIAPIYVDRFTEYANQPTFAEYYGDACDLPFRDSSLNYVATSHVIEHVANPLAAIMEWYRVLRNDGIIYMVVPDRRLTFDRSRSLTSVTHILDDYKNGTTQVDGTHIDDFVLHVDWKEFSPGTPDEMVAEEREQVRADYRKRVQEGAEINIHFHTFELQTMKELLTHANDVLPLNGGRIEVLRTETEFPRSRPEGFLIVAIVKKPGVMPAFDDEAAILLPGAVKLASAKRVRAEPERWTRENFPESSYLKLNADVAAAVAQGHIQSGFDHYEQYGRTERRRVRE